MTPRAVLSPSAKVGITTVAVTIVVIMVGVFLGWFKKQNSADFELNFHFDSIRGLTRDAAVLRNGNPLGRVVDWKDATDQGINVQVSFDDPNVLIHSNAVAVITAESVLGQKVIAISEPLSGVALYPQTDPKSWKDKEKPEYSYVWPNPQRPEFRFKKGDLRVGDPLIRQTKAQLIEIGSVADVRPSDFPGFETVTFDVIGAPIEHREAVVAESSVMLETGRVAKIYAPMKHGEFIEGIKEPEAADIIASVNDVVKEINSLIGTLTPEIRSITEHLDDVLVGVNEVLDKEQIDALFASLQRELTDTGRNIDLVTADLRAMLADSKPILDDTLLSANASAKSVEHITSEMDSLITDPDTRRKIESMLTELEATTKRLNAISEDIESISGDPAVQEDIKGSIKAARSTLEGADQSLQKVNQLTADLGGYNVSTLLKERYDVDSERAYTDIGVEINKPGEHRFGVGASNIGERTRLDAHYGFWMTDEVLARGGLRRGKVGVGTDVYFAPFSLSADLYDANDPMLDIWGSWSFDDMFSAQVGIEDVIDEGTDRVNLGATIKF